MRVVWLLSSLCFVTFVAEAAQGQGLPTTVQLPSFHFFTVQTTVSVPDQGTMSLTGSRPASTGSTAYGPSALPPQRGAGVNIGGGTTQVSATIHDMRELDEQLLKQAKHANANSARPVLSLSAGTPPVGSVAEAARQRAEEVAGINREAVNYFDQGRAAEVAGKPSVARIYYQMAARRATGELKNEVAARLAAVSVQRSK